MPSPFHQAAMPLRFLCQCLARENALPAWMRQVFAATSRYVPRTPYRIQVPRFVRGYGRVLRAVPLLDSRRCQRNLAGRAPPDFDILGLVARTPELPHSFARL